jgi:hypothetical protein
MIFKHLNVFNQEFDYKMKLNGYLAIQETGREKYKSTTRSLSRICVLQMSQVAYFSNLFLKLFRNE